MSGSACSFSQHMKESKRVTPASPERIPSITLNVNSLLTSSGCGQSADGHREGYPIPLKSKMLNLFAEIKRNKIYIYIFITNFKNHAVTHKSMEQECDSFRVDLIHEYLNAFLDMGFTQIIILTASQGKRLIFWTARSLNHYIDMMTRQPINSNLVQAQTKVSQANANINQMGRSKNKEEIHYFSYVANIFKIEK